MTLIIEKLYTKELLKSLKKETLKVYFTAEEAPADL